MSQKSIIIMDMNNTRMTSPTNIAVFLPISLRYFPINGERTRADNSNALLYNKLSSVHT